jgi:hypothetical protein
MEEEVETVQKSVAEPVKNALSSLSAALSHREEKYVATVVPVEQTPATPESAPLPVAPSEDTKGGGRRSVYTKEEMMQ